jgi:Uma2 family endonuclease
MTNIEAAYEAAEEIGIKLEIVNGLTIWEGSPVYKHQKAIDRIRASMQRTRTSGSDCGCIHIADVGLLFPDGSKKRPDISIFCVEPPEDGEIQLIPEAVIEVLSKGYEKKDTEISAPFYLSQGVKDVILFDPSTRAVTHLRRDGRRDLTSPVHLDLECGCSCTV